MELPELRIAALGVVLGLPSPTVAFCHGDACSGSNDVSIASRNEELIRHRGELAAAVVNCQLAHVLFTAVAETGAQMIPELASFLSALLQPEIADTTVAVNSHDLTSEIAVQATAEVLVGSSSAAAMAAIVEARRAAAALCTQLSRYSGLLWGLLAEVPIRCCSVGRRSPPGFLQACADLAYFVPPSEECLQAFLANWLACGGASADPVVLAALCFTAANAEVLPGAGGPLISALVRLSAEAKVALVSRWEHWRGPVKLLGMGQWAMLLDIYEAHSVPPHATQPQLPATPAVTTTATIVPQPLLQSGRGRGTILQELVASAPAKFRCAFDGQLMMDPVCSPQGIVFDRTALAHALGVSGGFCPISGSPLELEQCARLPDLRKRMTKWVREQRPADRHSGPRLVPA